MKECSWHPPHQGQAPSNSASPSPPTPLHCPSYIRSTLCRLGGPSPSLPCLLRTASHQSCILAPHRLLSAGAVLLAFGCTLVFPATNKSLDHSLKPLLAFQAHLCSLSSLPSPQNTSHSQLCLPHYSTSESKPDKVTGDYYSSHHPLFSEVCVHACVCACVCACACMCVHVYVCAYVCTHMIVCLCMCVYMCALVCVRVSLCACACLCVHVCIVVCACVLPSRPCPWGHPCPLLAPPDFLPQADAPPAFAVCLLYLRVDRKSR